MVSRTHSAPEAGPSHLPPARAVAQSLLDNRVEMLLRELMSKTDALASTQGEMTTMMQALAASMRNLEERLDQHIAASDDEDNDDEDEEEEVAPVVGKGKGRADTTDKGRGAK